MSEAFRFIKINLAEQSRQRKSTLFSHRATLCLYQVFLSFIAAVGEQAKCQVATNDNIAIFKGRVDL